MKTFFLITNNSGVKYWSYLGTKDNTTGTLRDMVEKHGNIYINDKGGWFTQAEVKEVHEVRLQKNFPVELPPAGPMQLFLVRTDNEEHYEDHDHVTFVILAEELSQARNLLKSSDRFGSGWAVDDIKLLTPLGVKWPGMPTQPTILY